MTSGADKKCGMRSAIAGLTLGGPVASRPGVVFQHSDRLPGRAIAWLVRDAARRSDLVVVPSRVVADDLDPRSALHERLRIVRPGVDASQFDAAGPPAEPAEVLVLGSITEYKRPDLALEAFALARRSRPELRLRLAGAPVTDGDERLAASLRARAARPDLEGSVELLGAVKPASEAAPQPASAPKPPEAAGTPDAGDDDGESD